MSDINLFKKGMQKTTEHLKMEYAKLQTGRASASLVEGIMIDAYGQKQPLKGVAGISIQDARTIVIQPWDKGVMQQIESAIRDANIGVNPVNDGVVIRLNLPPMTEERRLQIVKIVKELAEEARISVRQQRQEFHSNSKRDESRSEDEHRDFETALQKEVDKANKELEEISKSKEEDIMQV
ncbi:ribosome recycling factor [Candidatus Peribacteria bacterium]|jgi:ribosome recycling factor|nr:ribosome recycling factor [Candidatus Peribacteria bacterium]MBT4021044.1 ribosome recycling factor [Candidatus Peribacteria bacterium]MBT4240765.1 ribosome recycling factor [Candidatus Peribacteria bacterium]MBT4474206.1 ribosome recycling factor [Candidatus Peribacteria bacterium]